MKNNNLLKWSVSAIAVSLFTLNKGCADTIKVSIQVVDQDGLPVVDAKVDSGSKKKINTNTQGNALVELNKYSSGIRFAAKKEGYYSSETHEYFPMSKDIKQSKTIKVELKKIKKPTAMYAKDMMSYSSRGVRIPIMDKEVGYDLIIGDWVTPHGKGEIDDFIFKFEGNDGKVRDLDEWEKKISLRFSNEKDGVIAWKGLSEEGREYGSHLASDYKAPPNGYQSNWVQRTWKKDGLRQTSKDIDRNFYFRVRTKLDNNGNIESAHYGKIYGDFMSFIYYLNPTPNDRNVEFDPLKNLFKNETIDRP